MHVDSSSIEPLERRLLPDSGAFKYCSFVQCMCTVPSAGVYHVVLHPLNTQSTSLAVPYLLATAICIRQVPGAISCRRCRWAKAQLVAPSAQLSGGTRRGPGSEPPWKVCS